MSRKQRNHLSNMNRIIIFSLTMAALFMDGFQFSDIAYTTALVIWLWMPLCTLIEAKAIDYISTR